MANAGTGYEKSPMRVEIELLLLACACTGYDKLAMRVAILTYVRKVLFLIATQCSE